MEPSLSVITICFNNLPELVATCASVDAQEQHPDEHLIVDGSTDERIVNWLSSNPQPVYRRWIHERDHGISDAFNKGITHSRGEITHLLNSGDRYYAPGAIAMVIQAFSTDAQLQWVHGLYVQHRGGVDVISGTRFDAAQLWKGMRTVAHPTMFIRRDCYEKHGLYNTDLKVAMDYDLLLRIRNEKFAFIRSPMVYFAPGGASHIQFEKGLSEVRNSYRQHVGRSWKQTLWQTRQRLLHGLMETGVGRRLFAFKNRKKTVTA